MIQLEKDMLLTKQKLHKISDPRCSGVVICKLETSIGKFEFLYHTVVLYICLQQPKREFYYTDRLRVTF